MPAGWRLLFALLSLVPLLAPYELLVRVEWNDYFHPFFLLAAIVSAGAVAVSVFFLFSAAAGLTSRMRFDRARSTFTYSGVWHGGQIFILDFYGNWTVLFTAEGKNNRTVPIYAPRSRRLAARYARQTARFLVRLTASCAPLRSLCCPSGTADRYQRSA